MRSSIFESQGHSLYAFCKTSHCSSNSQNRLQIWKNLCTHQGAQGRRRRRIHLQRHNSTRRDGHVKLSNASTCRNWKKLGDFGEMVHMLLQMISALVQSFNLSPQKTHVAFHRRHDQVLLIQPFLYSLVH
ncbi:hypothetical protein BDL97_04G015700 [Sphagnum fallax]|nr:hypothetical protein BDL97_04G015700 [Sphagnum fallax]